MSDAASQEYGVSGLYTNPNPNLRPPAGALLRADEVVLRRPGMADPRPGFKAGSSSGLGQLYKLIPFASSVLHVGRTAGAVDRTVWPTPTTVQTEGGADLSWARHATRAVEVQKNLYLTTSDAPRKLTSSSDATARRSGVHRVWVEAVAGSSGSLMPEDTRVAFRVVVRRTDANGLTLRSAPSARRVLAHGSGGAVAVTVTVYFHEFGDLIAGDVLEVYRSRTVPVAYYPRDEMFLDSEHEITSSEITAGFVALTCDTADDDLGLACYTNPSREGVSRQNERPPLCTDAALFAGSLFLSGIKWPHFLQMRVIAELRFASGATGIGRRLATGTRTNASATITGLSTVVGIQVGQVLSDRASWSGSGPVRITAIVGSDVTMSATWGGATDGAPASLNFDDTIRINDGSTDLYYSIHQITTFIRGMAFDNATIGTSAHANLNAYPISDVGDSATSVRRTIVIEALLPSRQGFTVWATHGDEYEPPLPLPTAGSGEASAQDDFPNAITWSKGDQPEHFTRARWFVGNKRSSVLRVCATKEALWILKGKGDGIYRLAGFSERTGWRVDQWAPDIYLLHPDLAVVHDDAVWAWTNKGLLRISDAGVEQVARSYAIADLTALFEQHLTLTASTPPAFAVSNGDELYFGLADWDDENASAAERVLVHRPETKAWAQWFAGLEVYSCGCYDPNLNRLMFGRNDSGTPRVERTAAIDTIQNADREFTCTISTVAGATITIAGGSGWTPAVGDLLVRGSVYAVVVDVDSATVFDVHDATGITAGAATGYEAFTSGLAWLPKVGPGGAMVKRWTEVKLAWDDTFGLYAWDVLLSGTMNPGTEVTRSHTRDYQRSGQVRADTRTLVPREVALNVQLYPVLEVTQADARWRVGGLTTEFNPAGGKVSR